jgi:nitroreductase
MELMEAIEKRRTVRDFSDKKVPEAVIEKALYAGLRAPSYNHQKQVYFTLVRDPELRLGLIAAEGMKDEVSEKFKAVLKRDYERLAQEMYMDAIPKQNRMLKGAPELLVVSYKPKKAFSESRTPADQNCHAAVWACIENILLSLAENDVYGTTMVPDNTAAMKEVLGMPQELEIAVLLPFGYKSQEAKVVPQKEVSVSSALHIDRWE